MTTNQSKLESAIWAMEDGKLNAFETQFIESIKCYTKQQLSKLSSKQYDVLVKCSLKSIR